MAGTQKRGKKRFDREEWLSRALDILARKGGSSLRIEDICRALGVSRGSFYWHFESRSDFVNALLEYWHETYSVVVPPQVEALGGSPEDRLLRLMTLVFEKNYIAYDMPIREWAARDETVAEFVYRTDRFRLEYIGSLFAQMGFTGNELEVRTRACLAFLLSDVTLFDRDHADFLSEKLETSHAFFVSRKA